MNENFKPKAVTDIEMIIIVMRYLTSRASMNSIAKEYGIVKSTIWKYLHSVREYDPKLAELVNYKVSVVTNAATLDRFKLSARLESHLNHVISKLSKRTTLPKDISSYIWDGYTSTK